MQHRVKRLRAIVGPKSRIKVKALPECLSEGRVVKGSDSENPPVLYHSARVAQNTKYRYVVGYHKWISEAIDNICANEKTTNSYQNSNPESLVLFFKGYAPAKKAFSDLCLKKKAEDS